MEARMPSKDYSGPPSQHPLGPENFDEGVFAQNLDPELLGLLKL